MKKMLLITTVIIIAILVVVPTVAYFSLKNKDLQKWASDRIESTTGIEISMDNYDLSFPARIQVHNLYLKTPDGIQVQTKLVAVRPSMLKLVTGSLYLKSVIINGANIIIPLTKEKKPETAKNIEKPAAEKSEQGTLPLGNLEIRDATFHVIGNEKETEISGINVSLKPGTGFQLAMSPGDPANQLTLNGTFENQSDLKNLHATLKISKIQPLLKLLPEGNIPIEKLTGTANFSLKKAGNNFSFHGAMDFPTLNVRLDKNPLPYPVKGKINGTAATDGSRITLHDSTLTVRAATFGLKGQLVPDTSLSFRGDKLNLQDLVKLIPPSQSPFPEDTTFKGTVDLSGTGGATGVAADLKIKDAHVTMAQMAPLEINGKIHLTEKQITIAGLLLTNPKTDLTINGTIDQYLSDHGTTNLKIRGKMLNFVSKTAKTGENSSKSNKNGENLIETGQNKPIPVNYPDFEGMTHNLDCAIGAVFLPGLTLSDLKVKLTAGDKGTFLKQCTGTTLDGTFSMNGKLLPEEKGIKFSARGQAKRLKLTGIFSGKLPVEGGRLSTAFNMAGKGSDSKALKQTANGTLKFNITDAVLRDTPALRKVEELTGMKFIGKKMNHFDGEAKILDGKAEIRNTRMSAAGIRADFSGTVSLNGKLNIKAPVQVSGEAGKKLPAKLRLLESNGKVTLPLEIKGEVQKPKVKLDMKDAKKAVRKKLKKKLLNKLFGN